jgi:DNA-binding NtrC family response regulator
MTTPTRRPIAPLYVVVTRGPASGARLRVDAQPRIVGRGRSSDLVVADVHVSRSHLRVRAANDGVLVEVCEGAEPLLVAGAPARDATLRPGETIVIGDTALSIAQIDDADIDAASVATEVRALMTGLAADVRGVAVVMDLVDRLDAANDDDAVVDALRAWGREHIHATDATFARGATADPALSAGEARVVERAGRDAATTLVSAQANGVDEGWLTFTCAVAGDGVTSTTRRLVALAARLSALALTRTRALRRAEDERETFRRAALGSARSFLGDSAGAREVARLTQRLAASSALALLEGETGVGKTFVARLIHEASDRAGEPLRIINCAAIPDALLESELFGHERGAFTGANGKRAGAFESAGRGTVLLDEVGELPLASQAKLLRVLEEKRFERLGSNRPLTLEARVLTATNRDLEAMVADGAFRSDLFYRIAVVRLRIPPLRDRGDDLVVLAQKILADLAPSAARRVDRFSPAALAVVRRYPWPGNVRELKNAIERALVVGDGPSIEPFDLPETVHGAAPPQPTDESLVRLPANLAWIEARAIEAALRSTGGNRQRAALILGINRVTLHRKLRSKDGQEDGGD